METIFDKNTYLPNEMCRAKIVLDNSQRNVALESVRLAVEQELEFHANGHVHRELRPLVEQT